MYILNITRIIPKNIKYFLSIKKLSVNEIRNILFENLYKHVGFSKENSYYSKKHQKKYLQLFATKLTAKIPYPSNDKEHYQSFIRSKNAKSAKR